MTWEWKIGDPVDDSNGGTMDAMNWGHGSDDEDNDYGSRGHNGNRSYGGYRPSVSQEEINRRKLGYKRDAYKRKLEKARNQTNDEYRIKYYGEVLECAHEYFEESKKLGVTVDGMPSKYNLLSKADIDWISKKHYDEFHKVHIISRDQTENLENLLKESGNADRIKKNKDAYKAEIKANAKRRGIQRAKYLKWNYFHSIEMANDFVLKNKPHQAINRYQEAISSYNRFFANEYAKESMKRNMPEKSLTPDVVDHIMILYKKTHPLLTSKKSDVQVNREILEMLGGDWDDRLAEADREVAQIVEQKNLERQRRKEKVEDIAIDVIVGERIVGNSILNRFKR